jgi:apolipoprotein N-acyltransferase
MNRKVAQLYRRAGVDAPAVQPPLSTRWFGRLGILLVGTALLTLAFAPVNQFYLAWAGLVPFLLVISRTRSQWSAFFWGWVAGTLFFIANMWWMAYVTVPGMIALMAILGLYWGAVALIVRSAGLLDNTPQAPHVHVGLRVLMKMVLIATVWVAVGEWLRGTWPWNGLPWLYLGYTQSSALWLCQIADITGVAGVSFLIAMTNAWIALWLINRLALRPMIAGGIVVTCLITATVGYSIHRFKHEQLTTGPRVLVVQPNYPQSNSGEKGVSQEQIIEDHLRITQEALAKASAVDLIVWSETMMPALNPKAREFLRGTHYGETADTARSDIANLAFDAHTAVLTGGAYMGAFDQKGDELRPKDTRNVAYYFDRHGVISDLRYDKIHLVPFGEFIPFQQSFPPLYRLMIRLGPPDMEEYQLTPGADDQLTVFPLVKAPNDGSWRFVTPICFEDIDADLCAKMFRPDAGDPNRKRADILINITNDGWFKANENSQHLQAAVFRSIENRVPTARSVNTGISGFIDPLGRSSGLLDPRAEGTSVGTLWLDSRVTFFTRHGQIFAWICAFVTICLMVVTLLRWAVGRLSSKSSA